MPRVLFGYFLRQYTLWLALSILLITIVGFFGDLAELLRINSYGKNFTFALMLQMAAYKSPDLLLETLPFAFLLATSGLFLRMGETHELLIARLGGITLWRIITPFLVFAVVLNLLCAALLSPIAAISYSQYKQLRWQAENHSERAAITPQYGLWLYQDTNPGYHIFYARRWDVAKNRLIDPRVFVFDAQSGLQLRWEAKQAEWRTAGWTLFRPTKITAAGTRSVKQNKTFSLAYDVNTLKKQFPSAREISFWQLPKLIRIARTANLPSAGHQVQWHKILANFLLLWAMIGLASIFGLYQIEAHRHRERFALARFALIGGLGLGVMVFFLLDFLQGLGRAGFLSPILATWVPPGIACLAISAALWQLDDKHI